MPGPRSRSVKLNAGDAWMLTHSFVARPPPPVLGGAGAEVDAGGMGTAGPGRTGGGPGTDPGCPKPVPKLSPIGGVSAM